MFLDYDNDGWPDLYACAVAGGDRLFRNQRGKFVEVTGKAGIPAGRWASMATVADYDRNGFLDIYVIRMGDHEKSAPRPNYQANNGVPNTLLHNNGDGTFTDVTQRAGVGDKGWGLAGAWGDYDEDGWPDIYVANEFGFNVLYRNNQDGTFADVTDGAGVRDGQWGWSGEFLDYDNDGDLDIYAVNGFVTGPLEDDV